MRLLKMNRHFKWQAVIRMWVHQKNIGFEKELYVVYGMPTKNFYASITHIDIWFMFKDNVPELSVRITKDYFENNLVGQEGNFDFADGSYTRSIPQNELELAFDDTDDGKCR